MTENPLVGGSIPSLGTIQLAGNIEINEGLAILTAGLLFCE
jgi:hypothetical protein